MTFYIIGLRSPSYESLFPPDIDASVDVWASMMDNNSFEKMSNIGNPIYGPGILPDIGRSITVSVLEGDYENEIVTSTSAEFPPITPIHDTNLPQREDTILVWANGRRTHKLDYISNVNGIPLGPNPVHSVNFQQKPVFSQQYSVSISSPSALLHGHGLDDPSTSTSTIRTVYNHAHSLTARGFPTSTATYAFTHLGYEDGNSISIVPTFFPYVNTFDVNSGLPRGGPMLYITAGAPHVPGMNYQCMKCAPFKTIDGKNSCSYSLCDSFDFQTAMKDKFNTASVADFYMELAFSHTRSHSASSLHPKSDEHSPFVCSNIGMSFQNDARVPTVASPGYDELSSFQGPLLNAVLNTGLVSPVYPHKGCVVNSLPIQVPSKRRTPLSMFGTNLSPIANDYLRFSTVNYQNLKSQPTGLFQKIVRLGAETRGESFYNSGFGIPLQSQRQSHTMVNVVDCIDVRLDALANLDKGTWLRGQELPEISSPIAGFGINRVLIYGPNPQTEPFQRATPVAFHISEFFSSSVQICRNTSNEYCQAYSESCNLCAAHEDAGCSWCDGSCRPSRRCRKDGADVEKPSEKCKSLSGTSIKAVGAKACPLIGSETECINTSGCAYCPFVELSTTVQNNEGQTCFYADKGASKFLEAHKCVISVSSNAATYLTPQAKLSIEGFKKQDAGPEALWVDKFASAISKQALSQFFHISVCFSPSDNLFPVCRDMLSQSPVVYVDPIPFGTPRQPFHVFHTSARIFFHQFVEQPNCPSGLRCIDFPLPLWQLSFSSDPHHTFRFNTISNSQIDSMYKTFLHNNQNEVGKYLIFSPQVAKGSPPDSGAVKTPLIDIIYRADFVPEGYSYGIGFIIRYMNRSWYPIRNTAYYMFQWFATPACGTDISITCPRAPEHSARLVRKDLDGIVTVLAVIDSPYFSYGHYTVVVQAYESTVNGISATVLRVYTGPSRMQSTSNKLIFSLADTHQRRPRQGYAGVSFIGGNSSSKDIVVGLKNVFIDTFVRPLPITQIISGAATSTVDDKSVFPGLYRIQNFASLIENRAINTEVGISLSISPAPKPITTATKYSFQVLIPQGYILKPFGAWDSTPNVSPDTFNAMEYTKSMNTVKDAYMSHQFRFEIEPRGTTSDMMLVINYRNDAFETKFAVLTSQVSCITPTSSADETNLRAAFRAVATPLPYDIVGRSLQYSTRFTDQVALVVSEFLFSPGHANPLFQSSEIANDISPPDLSDMYSNIPIHNKYALFCRAMPASIAATSVLHANFNFASGQIQDYSFKSGIRIPINWSSFGLNTMTFLSGDLSPNTTDVIISIQNPVLSTSKFLVSIDGIATKTLDKNRILDTFEPYAFENRRVIHFSAKDLSFFPLFTFTFPWSLLDQGSLPYCLRVSSDERSVGGFHQINTTNHHLNGAVADLSTSQYFLNDPTFRTYYTQQNYPPAVHIPVDSVVTMQMPIFSPNQVSTPDTVHQFLCTLATNHFFGVYSDWVDGMDFPLDVAMISREISITSVTHVENAEEWKISGSGFLPPDYAPLHSLIVRMTGDSLHQFHPTVISWSDTEILASFQHLTGGGFEFVISRGDQTKTFAISTTRQFAYKTVKLHSMYSLILLPSRWISEGLMSYPIRSQAKATTTRWFAVSTLVLRYYQATYSSIGGYSDTFTLTTVPVEFVNPTTFTFYLPYSSPEYKLYANSEPATALLTMDAPITVRVSLVASTPDTVASNTAEVLKVEGENFPFLFGAKSPILIHGQPCKTDITLLSRFTLLTAVKFKPEYQMSSFEIVANYNVNADGSKTIINPIDIVTLSISMSHGLIAFTLTPDKKNIRVYSAPFDVLTYDKSIFTVLSSSAAKPLAAQFLGDTTIYGSTELSGNVEQTMVFYSYGTTKSHSENNGLILQQNWHIYDLRHVRFCLSLTRAEVGQTDPTALDDDSYFVPVTLASRTVTGKFGYTFKPFTFSSIQPAIEADLVNPQFVATSLDMGSLSPASTSRLKFALVEKPSSTITPCEINGVCIHSCTITCPPLLPKTEYDVRITYNGKQLITALTVWTKNPTFDLTTRDLPESLCTGVTTQGVSFIVPQNYPTVKFRSTWSVEDDSKLRTVIHSNFALRPEGSTICFDSVHRFSRTGRSIILQLNLSSRTPKSYFPLTRDVIYSFPIPHVTALSLDGSDFITTGVLLLTSNVFFIKGRNFGPAPVDDADDPIVIEFFAGTYTIPIRTCTFDNGKPDVIKCFLILPSPLLFGRGWGVRMVTHADRPRHRSLSTFPEGLAIDFPELKLSFYLQDLHSGQLFDFNRLSHEVARYALHRKSTVIDGLSITPTFTSRIVVRVSSNLSDDAIYLPGTKSIFSWYDKGFELIGGPATLLSDSEVESFALHSSTIHWPSHYFNDLVYAFPQGTFPPGQGQVLLSTKNLINPNVTERVGLAALSMKPFFLGLVSSGVRVGEDIVVYLNRDMDNVNGMITVRFINIPSSDSGIDTFQNQKISDIVAISPVTMARGTCPAHPTYDTTDAICASVKYSVEISHRFPAGAYYTVVCYELAGEVSGCNFFPKEMGGIVKDFTKEWFERQVSLSILGLKYTNSAVIVLGGVYSSSTSSLYIAENVNYTHYDATSVSASMSASASASVVSRPNPYIKDILQVTSSNVSSLSSSPILVNGIASVSSSTCHILSVYSEYFHFCEPNSSFTFFFFFHDQSLTGLPVSVLLISGTDEIPIYCVAKKNDIRYQADCLFPSQSRFEGKLIIQVVSGDSVVYRSSVEDTVSVRSLWIDVIQVSGQASSQALTPSEDCFLMRDVVPPKTSTVAGNDRFNFGHFSSGGAIPFVLQCSFEPLPSSISLTITTAYFPRLFTPVVKVGPYQCDGVMPTSDHPEPTFSCTISSATLSQISESKYFILPIQVLHPHSQEAVGDSWLTFGQEFDFFYDILSTSSAILAFPCPLGHFLSESTGKCQICPIGTFMPSIKSIVFSSVVCSPCPRGMYAPSEGLSLCSPCTHDSQHISCLDLVNFGLKSIQSSSLLFLSEGDSEDDSESNVDRNSNPMLVDRNSSISLNSSSLNSFSNGIVCSTNEYLDTDMASPYFQRCVGCGRNMYLDREQNICKPCPLGTAWGAGNEVCTACPVGKATQFALENIPHHPTYDCTNCASNFFTAEEGQSVCSPCPAGQFSAVGSSRCELCPAGKYRLESQSDCIDCSVNTISSQPGSSLCTSCEISYGFYSPTIGQTVCLYCPSPKALDNNVCNEPDEIILCPTGQFWDTISVSCIEIPAGLTIQGPFEIAPTPCPMNTFGVLGGQCQPCPNGHHTPYPIPSTGYTSCSLCPDGKYSRISQDDINTGCASCALGSTSNSDQSDCTYCPLGSFGTYMTKDGLGGSYIVASCEVCGKGTVSFKTGSTACQACPPGSINSSTKTHCMPCDQNFIPDPTKSDCIACMEGTYSQPGDAACGGCNLKGFHYIPSAGCVPCPPGTFSTSLNGKWTCVSCSANTFTNTVSKTSCEACEPGKVSSSDFTRCQDCPQGSYRSETDQSCLICPAGSYSDAGAPGCTPCKPGKFQSLDNSSSCELCKAGTSSETEATTCFECPKYKVTESGGLESCSTCVAGKFSLHANSSTCTNCVAGSYGKDGNCESCLLGTYSQEGAESCSTCPKGTYSDANIRFSPSTAAELKFFGMNEPDENVFRVRVGCVPCERGKFSSTDKAETCSPCEPGTFSDTPGTVACPLCPTSSFSIYPQKTSCLNCPSGYKGSSNRLRCVCTPGFYTLLDSWGLGNHRDNPKPAYEYGQETTAQPEWFDQCQRCPEGARCSIEELYEDELGTNLGFWRSDAFSLEYHRCLTESHCPEAIEKSGEVGCKYGHGSVLCASCSPGFYLNNLNCMHCPHSSAVYVQSIFVIIVIFIVALAIVYGVALGDSALPVAVQTYLIYAYHHQNETQDETFIDKDGNTIQVNWRSTTQSAFFSQQKRRTQENDTETIEMTNMSSPSLQPLDTTDGNAPLRGAYARALGADKGWGLSEEQLDAYDYYNTESGSSILNSSRTSEEMEIHEANIIKQRYIRPSAVFRFKIFITFLQLGYLVTSLVEIPWPDSMRYVFRIYHTISFNIFEWTAAACFYNFEAKQTSTYYPIFWITMTSPLIILAIVFLFYGLPLMVYHNVLPATFHKILSAVFCVGFIARKGEKRREKDLQTRVSRREKLAGLEKTGTAGPEQLALYSTPDEVDETTRVGISRRVVLGQLMKVSIFTLFILFPRLVHVAVSLFHCKDVGSSGSFILNYMSDECYDDVWHSYVPLSALFLVIYGAILPGTLAYLLFRERTNLDSPLTILRYGAIYEGYLPARSWFEAVDILTKMFIAIIIPFMDPSYQLSLTTAILTCYLMSLLFFSPYYRKGDDRLHIAAILVVLLTAYVGHVFQFIERDAFSTSSGAGYGVSDSSKVAIVVLLTYCIVAFILYFIFQLFYIVKFNRKTSRNEKEKRGESRAHKLSLIYQSDTQKSPKPLKPLTSYRKQLKEHRKSNDNLSENVERNAKRATDYKITTSQSNQNLPNRRFSVFILENDAEDDSSNHDAVHEPLLISNSASPPASVPPPTRRGGLSVQNSDMPEVNEADQKIFTANATARRGAVMPKPPILPKENKDMFAEPARRRAITNMDALDAPVIDKNAFVDNTIRRGGVISQSVDPEVLAQVNKNMFSDNNERRRGVTTVPPPNLDPTSNELPTE